MAPSDRTQIRRYEWIDVSSSALASTIQFSGALYGELLEVLAD